MSDQPTHVYIVQTHENGEGYTIYGAHLTREAADEHITRLIAWSPTGYFRIIIVMIGEDTYDGDQVYEYSRGKVN